MESNKVYGHIQSFKRIDNAFTLEIFTEFLYEDGSNIKKSQRKIEINFDANNTTMSPVGEYEQIAMQLLEEFNDKTILLEKKAFIREQYLIGKLIDQIAYDIIAKTSLIAYYKSTLYLDTELN